MSRQPSLHTASFFFLHENTTRDVWTSSDSFCWHWKLLHTFLWKCCYHAAEAAAVITSIKSFHPYGMHVYYVCTVTSLKWFYMVLCFIFLFLVLAEYICFYSQTWFLSCPSFSYLFLYVLDFVYYLEHVFFFFLKCHAGR